MAGGFLNVSNETESKGRPEQKSGGLLIDDRPIKEFKSEGRKSFAGEE